jgi:hydroxymethylglutaryl-CoA lyase
MTEAVRLTDVTLRDGLQDQPVVVATGDKRALFDLLVWAGFRSLEVTSFMRKDRVPQLADAEALVAALAGRTDVDIVALVGNRRGLERALASGVPGVAFVVSASDAHNEANLGRPTAASLAEIRDLAAAARQAGRRVRGGVATAFGCPYQGAVAPAAVLRVVEAYLDAGVLEVTLADTIGVATPATCARLLAEVVPRVGADRLGLHLHDPGTGVGAIVRVALDHGLRAFDVALAGVGGCPFAPGAPGNAKAEELVPLLESLGYQTGVDATRLPTVAFELGRAVARGEPLPSAAAG